MRLKWLVTPTGRRSSKSGCTIVFVDGAKTPNLQRHPRTSRNGQLLCGRGPATIKLSERAQAHMLGSVPGREDRMQPIGKPLSAKPAGTETMGPPSAVQGDMYLGSPVEPRP